jgi:alkylation response protein AidB-like acyl-CoA dehydrogenase
MNQSGAGDVAGGAEDRAIREEIVSFARTELNPGAQDRDRDQIFSRELWRKCGTIRLPGLLVPTEFGGRGLDASRATAAIEALGYGCTDGGLAFAICAHLLACVIPILRHGDEELKRRWLPGLSDGSLVAANAMSEPQSGSDVFALSSRARPVENGYSLEGKKTFVSNGPVADLFVTYAATDASKGFHGGVTAFAVPAGTAGLNVGPRLDKMALRTCQMSDVTFDGAVVPSDAVIGRVGSGGAVFAESMEWERVILVALHVGAMQRILEETVRYARTRNAGGQPIGKFQAVAHRIADMKVRLEASRLLVYHAASMLGKKREAGEAASIAKLFASEALLTSATDAVRTLGGYGVLENGDAERALRDAVASTIYSGTSDIQRNIISRWLGL